MSSNKNVWVALVVIGLIAIGGFLYPKVQTQVQPVLGSNPGPDSLNECTSQNGLTTCMARVGFNAASTTICSIKGPASTSTVEWVSIGMSVSTTSATILEVATSTTAFATTTQMFTATIATSTEFDIVGQPAYTSSSKLGLLAPDNWVVASMRQGIDSAISAGTYSPTGACQAQFRVVR